MWFLVHSEGYPGGSSLMYKYGTKVSMLHQRSVHGGQMFQCAECDYQVIQKGNLVTHKIFIHMDQKFQCPKCENLWRSLHMGQTVHCKNRDYKAIQKHSLVTHHKSSHKKFRCSECEYQLSSKNALPCIINLYILANNVLSVIIRSLRRVAWLLIINLYIWDSSFNVHSVNIKQIRKVTLWVQKKYPGSISLTI